VALALKAFAIFMMVAMPLAGAWIASSLAAYASGPVWAAALSGALVFPILPGVWEIIARLRRARAKARGANVRPPILTTLDRLILRTLLLSTTFVVGLLATYPETAFAALATRGDWMLGGREGGAVSTLRRGLLGTANAVSWLYEATHDRPYSDLEGDEPPPPHGSGDSLPVTTRTHGDDDASTNVGDDTPPVVRRTPDGKPLWPLPSTLEPSIAHVPPDAEKSIATLGAYIRASESDPFLRAKAVHDWIADRISYDVPAYRSGHFPAQDAETVFTTRKAVCAGYSLLFVALAKASEVDAVLVAGDARTDGNDVQGEGHAWNAVKIDGAYYLVDSTWDAGGVNGDDFKKSFGTDYLFTPPEIFGLTHFPEEKGWQLRDAPIGRGEFFRQPMMAPAFFAAGLTIVEPTRSQIEASGSLAVRVTNPGHLFLIGKAGREGSSDAGDCGVTSDEDATLTCPLREHGRYQIVLFSSRKRYGTYSYIGQIWVNAN